MESHAKILQLRQLLAERFPQPAIKPGSRFFTNIPPLDTALDGGLPKGALTELIAPSGTGSALMISAILQHVARTAQWLALIDGCDCFDPEPFSQDVLDHLLWARCENAAQAVKCADLLLRDGNLPLVILDLQQNATTELRRIPSTTWYRLQRVVEQSVVACLLVSPRAMAASAQVKLALRHRFPLSALNETQDALLTRLEIEVVRNIASAPQSMVS